MSRTPYKPIYAVDCETDPFEYGRIPRPFLWGVYEGYQEQYWEFENTDDCIDFLIERKVIAYAHNGGKFDWHFITHRFDPSESLLIINGRLAKFKIGECEFRDSYNLMPIALEQYQKTPFEYWKMEPAVRADYMDEIRSYLRDDCVNLWNMVCGFEIEYGRHLTIAGAAMKTWSKVAKRQPPKSSESHYDLFRPWYFGGRVQCFEFGDHKKRTRSIDINSAYPYAMLQKHPIGLNYDVYRGKPPHKNIGPLFLEIRCIPRGAFPYRGSNKMLYYPADDVAREYKVTGWELQAAIDTGTVEDLEYIKYTEIPETISFADFILPLWQKRVDAKREGDVGKNLYSKILANSCYGKFCADPRVYNNYTLMPIDKLTEAIDKDLDFDFFSEEWLLVSDKIKKSEYRFYNVATGASITGLVRAMLWRAICATPRVLYCDTDSILASTFPTDSDAIIFGPGLGQWEVEGYYDRAAIAGKKMYALLFSDDKRNDPKRRGQWKVRSKGARLTAEQLLAVTAGERITFRPEAPTFSVHRKSARFTPRVIRPTAADITIVPPQFDPQCLSD